VSKNNGVVRISRKGKKKFAFGEDGQPFEVDVVQTWQEWLNIDETLRGEDDKIADWSTYHQAAVEFACRIAGMQSVAGMTQAEALDFVARLREEYDDLAVFFRPRSREERGLQGTSEEAQSSTLHQKTELRFAVEEG
jgi:hypothetical protein